ncbi:MAPEG family protein [Synechococcus sp. NOUM97013]|uniref:MAPEG family protein n=1 Tax=Synechococcus sp. NOUM97013 TaxID=1442555 RepID=UPI001862917F|nr:MAPEG family protein [Synechococcus sp. NOUM97013]QNI72873.1 MAPEG family protein [Synechococcus sp. NOUM97013]
MDLSQSMAINVAPYVWSLILSFAALLVSIVLLYIARFSARLEVKDLAALRSMFDRYPAWGKRASWAQQNSFEAFTVHAPAALLAVVAVLSGHPLPGIAVAAAWAHPLLRLAYISTYLFNVPLARSFAWFLGLLCSGILYGVGIGALL